MCDVHDALDGVGHEDEFLLDTPQIREFIATVRRLAAGRNGPREACDAIQPLFAEMMENRTWLPDTFQREAPGGRMGEGIGQWLLFRAADRSLSFFSLVVPGGSMTPIHDHLAWGLIGLYRGNQDEEFYAPGDGRMSILRRRPLQPGDFYALIPPTDDIHRVRTTSDETSVSIHLLANDTGCVLRHTFDETTGESKPFRSGYVNAECPSDATADVGR